MYEIFADLHVHIGRSENGKPIKITAARSLNFANIAKECAERKGINVVGIIDCASPYVIEDIENFLKTGEAYELKDGGIIYKDKVCILLGSEVETSEVNEDGKTVAAVDLEVPGAGEIMGGSQREEDYNKLVARMKEMGIEVDPLYWYLDLRRYGSNIHSGFGLGFERLLMYITGIENIRDVIPYPRTPNNCEF